MTEAKRNTLVVLVVDDLHDQRQLVANWIKDECRVIEAESSEKALEIMRVFRIDILFTDSNLPSLDGKELARRAKADERFFGAIVFVSASAGHPNIRREMIEAGADAIVEKPFWGEQIRHVFHLVAPLSRERRKEAAKKWREQEENKRKEAATKRLRRVLEGIVTKR